MRNKISHITIGCCAVFFCAATCYAQYDSCARLKLWTTKHPQPPDSLLAKQVNDSLRLFIEKCAVIDSDSWQVFTSIDGAVQLMSSDGARFDQYRDWLISVLFLNKIIPGYFCACMGSISGTYQRGSIYFNVHNRVLAVENYLRTHHPECWDSTGEAQYQSEIAYEISHKQDTSLPPLDSIGLGFLLKSKAVSPTAPFSSLYLTSFTTAPNPFKTETTLNFTLNRMAYIQLAIYDVLGRLVWGDGRGSSLEAGEHTVHIDGKDLPGGTLYARISTGFGEVQTVKLVHEK